MPAAVWKIVGIKNNGAPQRKAKSYFIQLNDHETNSACPSLWTRVSFLLFSLLLKGLTVQAQNNIVLAGRVVDETWKLPLSGATAHMGWL